MSTLIIPFLPFGGNLASSSEFNQDFDALYDFINQKAVHRDGTNRFTTLPSLPSNPTTANAMARFGYAKLRPQRAKEASGSWGAGIQMAGDSIDPDSSNTRKWRTEGGSTNVTFTAGAGTLTLVTGFPNSLALALVTLSDGNNNTDGHRLRTVYGSSTKTSLALSLGNVSATARINYLAFGF